MSQFSVDTSAVGYTAASMSAALTQFDAQVAAVSAAVNGERTYEKRVSAL